MKRKSVSKKNKSSWRKHIDVKDVELFLEDQLLEERLGGSFHEKSNQDLYFVDQDQSALHDVHSKKAKASLPPRCFQTLKSCTSVPDPIIKRNFVKSKNVKNNVMNKPSKKGAIECNTKQLRPRKESKPSPPKQGDFNIDMWKDDIKKPLEDEEWLEDETKRHVHRNTKKLKVKQCKINKRVCTSKRIPAVNIPHSGMSYNPSFVDHHELLKEIADKELKLMKEEEHLDRVTGRMFSKLTPEENHTLWLTEMSEGLDKTTGDGEENGGEYKAINKPTSFDKKKTLKAKRKQREAKKEVYEKQRRLVEKKKTSDIYKLRKFEKEIKEKENKEEEVQKKRTAQKALEFTRTKHLAKQKFVEPDLEFNRPHEIAGNLRALKPEGNILTDRFYSMQKRNILEVTSKQFKCHKRKVKKFVKPSHRIPETTGKK